MTSSRSLPSCRRCNCRMSDYFAWSFDAGADRAVPHRRTGQHAEGGGAADRGGKVRRCRLGAAQPEADRRRRAGRRHHHRAVRCVLRVRRQRQRVVRRPQRGDRRRVARRRLCDQRDLRGDGVHPRPDALLHADAGGGDRRHLHLHLVRHHQGRHRDDRLAHAGCAAHAGGGPGDPDRPCRRGVSRLLPRAAGLDRAAGRLAAGTRHLRRLRPERRIPHRHAPPRGAAHRSACDRLRRDPQLHGRTRRTVGRAARRDRACELRRAAIDRGDRRHLRAARTDRAVRQLQRVRPRGGGALRRRPAGTAGAAADAGRDRPRRGWRAACSPASCCATTPTAHRRHGAARPASCSSSSITSPGSEVRRIMRSLGAMGFAALYPSYELLRRRSRSDSRTVHNAQGTVPRASGRARTAAPCLPPP